MKKKSIIYFTLYTADVPRSRYRSYVYHPYLEEKGFVVTVYPLFGASSKRIHETGKKPALSAFSAYIKRTVQLIFIKKYDLVFIEEELLPYLPFRLEKWLLRRQKHIITDYEEAAFYKYENSKKNWCGNKIQELAAWADVVITANNYLTRWMLPYAKEVTEIATGIPIQDYSLAKAIHLPEEETKMFRIVWLGTAAASSHLLLIKECLLQLHALYSIKLVLIGFDKRLETELKGLTYTNYKRSKDNNIALLKTCNVGVFLLPDNPLVRTGNNVVLLQYMACGLPIISTPTEANIRMNRGNDNLFANTRFEWYSCFTAIIQNKAFYKDAGERNRDIVSQYYSVENNQNLYLSLFQNILSKSL